MKPIDELVRQIIQLRESGREQITLLAVCPNSAAVSEAAVRAAKQGNAPMLFAATLNQVDRDGGYTGWTPQRFVEMIRQYADEIGWDGPLYPCLDHGGPWLKDRHRLDRLPLDQAMGEVKESLTACLEAGYQLLHIDPTVDPNLDGGATLPVEIVVDRTVQLIAHAEAERERLGLPPIAYEVGTEEVHGGLVDFSLFDAYLEGLRSSLEANGLSHAWPSFVVAQVGTDLHTTAFDPQVASQLYERVSKLGCLVKGHYTDDVLNPDQYPTSGMGGANVGPEFTSVEYDALMHLSDHEASLLARRPELEPSGIREAIEAAVVDSNRWRKWLRPEEYGLEFPAISAERRAWLVKTGARYVWTDQRVLVARQRLYANTRTVVADPHGYVVDRICSAIQNYIHAFNLTNSLGILAG